MHKPLQLLHSINVICAKWSEWYENAFIREFIEADESTSLETANINIFISQSVCTLHVVRPCVIIYQLQ